MTVHSPGLPPYSLDNLPPELRGGVVAIGNFDGVHRGHVAVLERARGEARRRGVAALVLTFEPHPRSVLRPAAPVFRLTPLPAKSRLLAALGMDGLVVVAFDRAFSEVTGEDFVAAVLVDRLRAVSVAVGHDFHFGKARGGSPAMLAAAGKRLGFDVVVVDPVSDPGGAVYGSSAIRDALAAGDIATANQLLGYRWFVIGAVIAGERRGRTLGFPTANIRLGDECRLRYGVYAVRLTRPSGATIDGVASYGRRPTFDNGPPLLEVFLFDFSADIYGEAVVVTFLDWIRAEARFDSVERLVEQIKDDTVRAKAILASADLGSRLDRALQGLA